MSKDQAEVRMIAARSEWQPTPYKESAEDAKKPHTVRHCLMSGHESKDRTLAALKMYIAGYSPEMKDTEDFMLNIGRWMLSWYNTLACNAVDLMHEYRALARDVESNIKAAEESQDTMRTEEFEKLQAQHRDLVAGQERNEQDWQYWNARYEILRDAVNMFTQDFRSTNYGHRR